jgi:hypothetical protein
MVVSIDCFRDAIEGCAMFGCLSIRWRCGGFDVQNGELWTSKVNNGNAI